MGEHSNAKSKNSADMPAACLDLIEDVGEVKGDSEVQCRFLVLNRDLLHPILARHCWIDIPMTKYFLLDFYSIINISIILF